MLFLSAVVSGIVLGCIYALVGAGLNLIFGVVKVINFAHGAMLMLGMYVVYWTVQLTGIDPYLALPVAVIALAALGYVVQRLLINPVLRKERISQLLITFGLGMAIENTVLALAGPDNRSVNTFLDGHILAWQGVRVSASGALLVGVAVITLIALQLFLIRTKTGTAIRSVSQQPDSAELVGIDVKGVYALTFAIGAGVTGMAAMLMTPLYDLEPGLGETFGIMAFIVVVLGGLGSVTGAAIAGVGLGVAQNLFATFFSLHMSVAFVFVLFLAVMFVRPQGLLGKRMRVA